MEDINIPRAMLGRQANPDSLKCKPNATATHAPQDVNFEIKPRRVPSFYKDFLCNDTGNSKASLLQEFHNYLPLNICQTKMRIECP